MLSLVATGIVQIALFLSGLAIVSHTPVCVRNWVVPLAAKFGYFFLFFVSLPLFFPSIFLGLDNCGAMVKIDRDGP